MKDEEPSNWAELPPELTSSVLFRLGTVEILLIAQKVCREWRRICKDPSTCWKIDMLDLGNRISFDHDFESMCRHAIDRSEGGLVEINTGAVGTDSLLTYIADRSSNLRSLALSMYYSMSNEGLVNAVANLPLLEDLEVSYTWSKLNLKAIGRSCPRLKTLKLNCSGYTYRLTFEELDDDAIAIAESMPELRHLLLFGNGLTNMGLNTILEGCRHLNHLDLHKCLNVNLVGDLEQPEDQRFETPQ